MKLSNLSTNIGRRTGLRSTAGGIALERNSAAEDAITALKRIIAYSGWRRRVVASDSRARGYDEPAAIKCVGKISWLMHDADAFRSSRDAWEGRCYLIDCGKRPIIRH